MNSHIAVDIGGTQLRAAAFSEDSSKPARVIRIPTRDESSSPLERLQALIQQIWPADQPVAGIAVATPGPTDPYRGIVVEAPNIPGWVDLPLRSHLEERFQVPVAVGNDANLAALGEWKFGAGIGHSHMIYVTISTGIGGGIIIDNRLLLGAQGLAGEIGHVTVIPDGPPCGCGGYGHLEALASGTAITRWVKEQLQNGIQSSLENVKPLNAKAVSEAAQKGDWLGITALSRAANYVGIALANLLHIFNPTAIIIGGGVSRSGPLLLTPMFSTMQSHVMNPRYLENLVLQEAKFGDDAGLMGALALARTSFPGQPR